MRNIELAEKIDEVKELIEHTINNLKDELELDVDLDKEQLYSIIELQNYIIAHQKNQLKN